MKSMVGYKYMGRIQMYGESVSRPARFAKTKRPPEPRRTFWHGAACSFWKIRAAG